MMSSLYCFIGSIHHVPILTPTKLQCGCLHLVRNAPPCRHVPRLQLNASTLPSSHNILNMCTSISNTACLARILNKSFKLFVIINLQQSKSLLANGVILKVPENQMKSRSLSQTTCWSEFSAS